MSVSDRGSLGSTTRFLANATGGLIAFAIILAVAEQMGMPDAAIGYAYMGITIGLYAAGGIASRASKIQVHTGSMPAVFNGMATASEWLCAASFIGMAGTIYHLGYDGLAYVMGWTGGYVLLAVFLGPYLRKFGQYTIPDFLGARYGGHAARTIGTIATITVSLTYLVAQVTGVGIIMSRFLGLDFKAAVFIGLAGILVCSRLGRTKAIARTQVAQYIILIIAYLIPPAVMSQKITGVPIPALMYGQVLQKVDAREKALNLHPTETAVRNLWHAEADRLDADISGLPGSLESKRADLRARLDALPPGAPAAHRELLQREFSRLPDNAADARGAWDAARRRAEGLSAPIRPYLEPFARLDMKNTLALTFCLMIGTVGLPHVLIRYYEAPSLKDARVSAGWSLFFIVLLSVTAPAYAAFARSEVLNNVVGLPIANLPAWVAHWGRVGLITFRDINADGILQFHELTISADAIVLALPEIAGLPYVVSGLVAAGALAAALSTADRLLLAISSALAHDGYRYRIVSSASVTTQLAISRSLLVLLALAAASAATFTVTTIVELVAWAYSIAAASFFPALAMGIWDKRANRAGALAGMGAGFGSCLFYMIGSRFFGLDWWGVKTVSSGIFGIFLGFVAIYAVSRLTAPPSPETQDFVENVRIARSPAQPEKLRETPSTAT